MSTQKLDNFFDHNPYSFRDYQFVSTGMDRIPHTLRTGFGQVVTPDRDDRFDEWIRIIECTFLAFVQRGFEFACQYANTANRNSCVTSKDCIYGLKYAARRFLYEDDFEQRVQRVMQNLESDNFEADTGTIDEDAVSSDEDAVSSDEDTVSSDEDAVPDSSEGDEVPNSTRTYTSRGSIICDALLDKVLLDEHANFLASEEEIPEFTRAPETDPFAKSVHEVVDRWNDWNPTDLVERLIKRSIDHADQDARRVERSDIVFRKRRTELSKRT